MAIFNSILIMLIHFGLLVDPHFDQTLIDSSNPVFCLALNVHVCVG